jgi:hypothetical protein
MADFLSWAGRCDFRCSEIYINNLMRKALLFLFLLLNGCSAFSREIELKGKLFVVTGDGQNIKLALVEVSAIPQTEMDAYLEKITPSLESEKARLQKTYDAVFAAYKAANIDLANAKSVLLTASLHREDEMQRLNVTVNDLGFKRAQVISLTASFDAKQAAMKTAKAELESFPGTEVILQGLPTGYAKALSDSDGNFTIKLKNKGKHALVAHSSAMVMGKQEQYDWLIWFYAEGNQQKPIILSNGNLMTTDAPENIKKVAGRTTSPDK